MQTSAPRQHIDLDVELSGILTADAEVRTRIEAGGRTSVVLRLQLEHQTMQQAVQRIVIEKTFNEMQRPQAEAEAKLYKKDRCISFESTPADMRIVFPNVSKITVL